MSDPASAGCAAQEATQTPVVSVIIPARNEAGRIGRTVRAALLQTVPGRALEVLVVDDGSRDDTGEAALDAGARVIELRGSAGNPGMARNVGAAASCGDPIVFLDADCVPGVGWLAGLLAAHHMGAAVVGGAIDAWPGQGIVERCDHFCGSFHVHPRRPRGEVPNHPPANLSVRRDAFFSTAGFAERLPVADGHEELAWQAELRRRGARILFEPAAVVHHRGRPGWESLFRRNYRWAYSAIQSKAETGAGRWPWLYRHPLILIAVSPVLALAHTAYTAWCWGRAGVFEPVAMLPAVLAARLVYAAGLAVGGIRWIRQPDAEHRAGGGR
jgi:glycosyltransferase involved in cell wall biosynthesis